MTPEGRVKAAIKKIIAAYHPHVYSHWPVQNGMGAPTLDCIGCVGGRYFAIEAKKPGAKPTERQEQTISQMIAAGARVFVIDGRPSQMHEFDTWLHKNVMQSIQHITHSA